MTRTEPRRQRAAGILFALPLLFVAMTCEDRGRTPAAAQDPQTPATPRVRLCLSGFMDGHLEPCGCASGQLGGLARRAFFLQSESRHDLRIEGGNLVAGGTPLDAQKLQTALTVLSASMAYETIAIGPHDLELPLAEIREQFASWELRPLASDLEPVAGVDASIAAFAEHKLPQVTVRVASLVGRLPDAAAGKLRLLDAQTAWTRALEGAADADYRILLVHGDRDQTRSMAALRPRPDLLVGITDAVSEPPAAAESVDGVPMVFPGVRGRMLLDVILTRTPEGPRVTRYEVLSLTGSETNKNAMQDEGARAMVLQHRHAVKDMGILEQMAERLPTTDGRTYVGSKVCSDCHEDAYASWQNTKHAQAWETLEKAEKDPTRYGWPVTAYPDCVGCHVVGYGYKSGFVNPTKTAHLKDVGCEQCHGPGSAHVDDPLKTNILLSGQADCYKCHDFEQSPNFDYKERWQKIKH